MLPALVTVMAMSQEDKSVAWVLGSFFGIFVVMMLLMVTMTGGWQRRPPKPEGMRNPVWCDPHYRWETRSHYWDHHEIDNGQYDRLY